MTETQIDLTPFCIKGPSSYQIGEPFVIGGKLYATNGHVLIELPGDGEPDTIDRKLPRDIASFLNLWRDDMPWTQLCEPSYVTALKQCRRCDGTGFAHHKACDRCNGRGEIDCRECGHEYDCRDCQGKGTIGCEKCDLCDGTKEAEQPSYAVLADEHVAYDVLESLKTLPSVCYSVLSGKVYLKFDGGRGIAMPLLK